MTFAASECGGREPRETMWKSQCDVLARPHDRNDIVSIAVYSDADRDALHVKECDEALRIGPPPARDSYLNIERVLEAAQRSAAQAIHPGYGFLSENPAFADACSQKGIIFVGPPASAMRAVGDKIAAKRAAAAIGVPTVPGYLGEDQSAAGLADMGAVPANNLHNQQ